MSKKSTVKTTTTNPAYQASAAMFKIAAVIVIVLIALSYMR